MKHSRRALLGLLAAAPLAPAVVAGAIPAVTTSTGGPTVRCTYTAYSPGYRVTPEDWATVKHWFATESQRVNPYGDFEPSPNL